jgi:hypothetical protein
MYVEEGDGGRYELCVPAARTTCEALYQRHRLNGLLKKRKEEEIG